MSWRISVAAVTAVVAGAVLVGAQAPDDVLLPAPVDPPVLRPAQDEPGPVLLVPGYGGERRGLLTLAGHIEDTGREVRVLRLAGDGTGDLTAQVRLLDAAVEEALAEGAPSVDVVGYSAGGVVAGLWIARAGSAPPVRRVVTLGSPLNGTSVAGFAATFAPEDCPTACRQLAPDSPVIAELERAAVGDDVPWLSVWTTEDELVTPPETARLDGAVNVAVQDVCPGARVGHAGLPTDRAVTGLVLNALSTAPIDAVGDCASVREAGAG